MRYSCHFLSNYFRVVSLTTNSKNYYTLETDLFLLCKDRKHVFRTLKNHTETNTVGKYSPYSVIYLHNLTYLISHNFLKYLSK